DNFGRLQADEDGPARRRHHVAGKSPRTTAFNSARKALVRHLVDLKAAITQANALVQSVIYELPERKALITLLAGLNNKHGKFVEGYSATAVNYVAGLRRGDINDEVRRLQADIDRRHPPRYLLSHDENRRQRGTPGHRGRQEPNHGVGTIRHGVR